MKYLFCWITGILLTASLHAQSGSNKNSTFFVHVGPSWYTGNLMGITDRSDAYCDDLRKGITWDAGFLRQVAGRELKFGVGFIYQGSMYKNTHDTGADKIYMNYLAPQMSLSVMREHFQLQLSGGVGYQFYRDKSTVYDKPRDVSMNKFAANLALSGEYYLAEDWGISARLNWLTSESERYSVKYHGTKWNVEDPKTGTGHFGQLSLSFGINYHF
ncbi:hypothetical protein [Bacteroides sp. UBA939]|uniref:hypothetical protein n=1 Tax=Bacteroides sp. UBA939 TaxID=1946092 RepID=UPI0025C50BFA|nr:hypothetical protein [Bacteroides sp. UBA939]